MTPKILWKDFASLQISLNFGISKHFDKKFANFLHIYFYALSILQFQTNLRAFVVLKKLCLNPVENESVGDVG